MEQLQAPDKSIKKKWNCLKLQKTDKLDHLEKEKN